MELLFKVSYGFYNPDTLRYDVKRALKAMALERIEEEVVGENSWRIKGRCGDSEVVAFVRCEYLTSKELPAFRQSYMAKMYGEGMPYCDLELYSDADKDFNERLRRRVELGLFRAGGV